MACNFLISWNKESDPMKTKFTLVLILIFAQFANAIRHVGSGGGISEQNLVFAFDHFRELTMGCKLVCDLTVQEKEFFENFQSDVQNSQNNLVFLQDKCASSSVNDFDWNICVPQIQVHDLNQDGFLDLAEAILFYIDLKKSSQSQSFSQKLFHFLNSQTSQFVFTEKSRLKFQFFGFRNAQNNEDLFFFQRENQDPIRIDNLLLQKSKCKQVRWMQPYFTEWDTTSTSPSAVVAIPYFEDCAESNDNSFQTRFLQLVFQEKNTVVK